jgi:hypothetical protein
MPARTSNTDAGASSFAPSIAGAFRHGKPDQLGAGGFNCI